MSSNLYWRPPAPEGKTLGDELKFILRGYFRGTSLYEWKTLGRGSVEFLRGVIAGRGKDSEAARDAQFLIDKIERYGEVDVREHS